MSTRCSVASVDAWHAPRNSDRPDAAGRAASRPVRSPGHNRASSMVAWGRLAFRTKF